MLYRIVHLVGKIDQKRTTLLFFLFFNKKFFGKVGSSMNNETLEAMMKMIDNILLKRLSSSTVSALALSYLLFKVKVTFSKLLEMIVGIIQTLKKTF